MNKIAKIFAFIGIIAVVIKAAYEAFKPEWDKFKENFPSEPEYIDDPDNVEPGSGHQPVEALRDPLSTENMAQAGQDFDKK